MPRIVRGLGDDVVYHVINRGNGRQEIFHKDKDYEAFVTLILEAKERYPVKLYGYCLMPNHFHNDLDQVRSRVNRQTPLGDAARERRRQRDKK